MTRATPRIAIIGAGMAGATCARRLIDRGHSPVLFEKSRGAGGRLATRRIDGPVYFDHGAHAVTAERTPFRSFLDRALRDGDAANWGYSAANAFVGTPKMKSLLGATDNLDIRASTTIRELQKRGDGWRLASEEKGDEGDFDFVVSTAPAPQAASILGPHDNILTDATARSSMIPVWALLAAFNERLAIEACLLAPTDGPIASAARNTAKPDRPIAPDAWVVHATPAWSAERVEWDRSSVETALLKSFGDLVAKTSPKPVYLSAHRWRYAFADQPFGAPFAASRCGTLIAAGDWCLGARAEDAFESGLAAANALAQRIST